MINQNLKNESETLEFKKVSIKEIKKDIYSNNFKNIFLTIIICFCVFSIISIIVFYKVKNNYLSQLQGKENKIKNIKKILNNKAKIRLSEENQEKKKEKNITQLEKEYLYDKNFYIYNNVDSIENLNTNAYRMIVNTHCLEKGLSHFNLRPFGKDKIKNIIKLLKKQIKYDNYQNHFSFIIGINSLRKYKQTYEEHKWNNKTEYKEVIEFLKNYKNIIKQQAGAYILTKKELKENYNINYKNFIKSRHSLRNYKNMKIKMEDLKEAIDIAKYTASACNRQYVKVHYYPNGKMKQNVIDYSLGKGGIYLEGVNTFIITFDVNGLSSPGERNQGYFNAGLFATNLVNAFHSLGIGTCLIQFANSVKQEEKLKELNEIPSNERIAVILYAGYYDEKSIFTVSPRKKFEDYFIEHR